MRMVCISDTHGQHGEMAIPSGDVLIHAGDLTTDGTVAAVRSGIAWLASLPHERIVFVPGNHDFAFERSADIAGALATEFPNVEILIDRATSVGGMRLYASPYQPWFGGWAYNFARGEAGAREAAERWARIPDDTEILVTHGPVRDILDLTSRGVRAGCPELRARIAQLGRLKLHVCGHIHEAYGVERHGDVLYVNASSCDLGYAPTQAPIIVDYTAGRMSADEAASQSVRR
jgi:Icc-related predicted phosphoesterase